MKEHKKTQSKATSDVAAHAKAVKAAVAKIKEALASVPGLVTLTAAERKRTLKLHVGGERYVTQMAALAKSDPTACPTGVDPAEMESNMTVDADLAELETALETGKQSVQDARLLATGSAWHDALDIYAVVQTQTRRDPSKHDPIAGFEHFLATGPHKPKEPPAHE